MVKRQETETLVILLSGISISSFIFLVGMPQDIVMKILLVLGGSAALCFSGLAKTPLEREICVYQQVNHSPAKGCGKHASSPEP